MATWYSPAAEHVHMGVAYMGSTVFTNNRTTDSERHGEQRDGLVNELVSHLPLQMLLYFDMFYFPCWWISAVFMLNVKFEFLPGYYQWLLVTGIVLLTVVEVLRVYLGYTGNLKEKVPELAAFWVVSLTFPVPVLLFFLTDEDALILPLERAVHSLFLCLVMAELVASFLALRTMTRKLLLLFHLRQLGRAERLSPVYGLTLPYHRGALAVTPVHHMYR